MQTIGGLTSRIYKDYKKLNSTKTDNTVNKWTNDMNKQPLSCEIELANSSHEENAKITSHLENTHKNHSEVSPLPVRMAIIKNKATKIVNVIKDDRE